ncbi:MAG TPA: hypothetical protein VM099_03480, partial [Gemmatimonadaceae bacterium]|nr:hypothetical protein [Gemmatimonadaceae bacterium]
MAELIVGMVILSIIGMALTRVMVMQARYFDHQKQANLARNVSRGPLNRLVSDIRMVEAEGGITAASTTSITARVPYAIGVVCKSDGTSTHISLLPVDSAMYAEPGYSGYAWRGGNAKYKYVMGTSTVASGTPGLCNAVGITTLTSQLAKVIKITPQLTDSASVGTPVFLLRDIKYEFKASTLVPNSTGLYRTVVVGNTSEELSAPYASGAAFKFFIRSGLTPQTSAPADLSTLRGIELNMTGLSEKKPRQAV